MREIYLVRNTKYSSPLLSSLDRRGVCGVRENFPGGGGSSQSVSQLVLDHRPVQYSLHLCSETEMIADNYDDNLDNLDTATMLNTDTATPTFFYIALLLSYYWTLHCEDNLV